MFLVPKPGSENLEKYNPNITLYELASKLLVCGNGGNHLGCPVSFCKSGRYRFGVSFFRVPRIVLQWI